ncbi:hypothetical protein HDV00_008514 [Rhizophlyctis rosea]|nr:hypothetical protein HDV00_008514 [Rhizophlyctis rosea]
MVDYEFKKNGWEYFADNGWEYRVQVDDVRDQWPVREERSIGYEEGEACSDTVSVGGAEDWIRAESERMGLSSGGKEPTGDWSEEDED